MQRKNTNNQKIIVKDPPVRKRPDAKLRKKPKYKSFRLHKSIKHHGGKLPSWFELLKKSLALIRVNWRQISVFVLVYALLNIILVRGFDDAIAVDELKATISDTLGISANGLTTGFAVLGVLAESTVQLSSESSKIYQFYLLIFASLAIIWLYRQQQAGHKVSMKMAFYRGMYPLIPFILVLMVIALQLVPAIVGNFMYLTIVEGGFAVGFVEEFVWLLLYLCSLLLTLYMVSGSFIALYVVTLPDMTPMVALRETRELVRLRRMAILFRIIALFVVMVIFLIVAVLPVIYFAPSIADWMFFMSTVFAIPFVHGYVFSLYRELL